MNLLMIILFSSFSLQAQVIWRVGIIGSEQDSFNPEAKAKKFALDQGKYLSDVCEKGNGTGRSWLGMAHCSGGGMFGQTCTVQGDTTCTQNKIKPIDAVGRTSRIGTGCGGQTSSAYREAKYDAEFSMSEPVAKCEAQGFEAEVVYQGHYCYSIGNLFCPWKCLVGAVLTCKDGQQPEPIVDPVVDPALVN